MSDRGAATVAIAGGGAPSGAEYEIERKEMAGGEIQLVEVTLDTGAVEISTEFELDEAEEFLVEFRDAIVDGKIKELEWETDTGPETGLASDLIQQRGGQSPEGE